MQAIAAEVNYSETVFASPLARDHYRVRYFSPQNEVAFCGHATIALGAALAKAHGGGTYSLTLNDANIQVEGRKSNQTDLGNHAESFSASLESPASRHKVLDDETIKATLALFNYSTSDLDDSIPPAHIHAGADHLVFALKSKALLSQMQYDLAKGRTFMHAHKLVTVMFVYQHTDDTFYSRNAFAYGGVYEDPATGAASAAFAGYLKALYEQNNTPQRKPSEQITFIQGEDMQARSIINASLPSKVGGSVTISGQAREIKED